MGKYMIIKREEYERMQESISQLLQTNAKYIENIRKSKIELLTRIDNLEYSNNVVLEKLQMTESARNRNAGKIGALTTNYNREKNKTKELLNTIDNQKEHYETKINELEDNVKDLEVKLEESMSDKYLVRKLPAGRRPKTQTMKLKSCTVQSNIARKMFGDSK